MLAQSPELEAHDKVLTIQTEFSRICKCWFFEEKVNRCIRRKTSRGKEENQQQTQPTYDTESGNRTRTTLVGGEYSHNFGIPAPLTSAVSLPPKP